MINENLTIKSNGTNKIIIKKSIFIASLARVQNENEAKNFINEINREHNKATHNCYAYMIGDDDHIQRASDNGEPSGTAGVPILEAIKKNNLHNVVIVVTRYFGGIKLGAGGLIRAYSNSASEGIKKIGIVNKVLQKKLKLSVSYPNYNKLEYYLSQNNILLLETNYSNQVDIMVSIDNAKVEHFKQSVIDLLNNQITINEQGNQFIEVDFTK
ncbi:YigZ family protein [Lactobacillus sp. S2-2]|uniref:YigZ family protein n=1 Tax=Lactobacillus sp. S2-2 TaxID=2692917 RepID=UPI001F234005|nr:YigZ family protein [Lactobacillus sp. S2-2]MCF6515680.1 YigZ family protein [Lactobacillus sp. S2-2]